ncbi:MAG: amino acid adenylation domain-containing protein [Stagnimonas sp.]|nr:amino acid adenylation domain-containing protein [Stagnimonas sp.]
MSTPVKKAAVAAEPGYVPAINARVELKAIDHDPFAGPALSAVAPITESQREIWLACQMDELATLAYNEASEITWHGPVDAQRLADCWREVVQRHEALRACFSPDGEWLCIRAELALEVPIRDLSSFGADERRLVLQGLRREAVQSRFDLEQGPLLRVSIVKLGPSEHRVFFVAHHIVVDGWSAAEIYQNIAALYDAKSGKAGPPLAPALSYCAFARDEAAWRQSEEGHATEQYWLAQFQDSLPSFELPADRPRNSDRSFAGARVDRRLDPQLVAALRRVGSANGASLVATTLAAFGVLLHRLSGAEDLVVGLAAAAQSYLGKNGLVGHAVNLLPLRLRPAADLPFADYLKDTRGVLLDAFEHQRFSFGSLLPKLKIARDPGRPPLVPVVFNIDVRNDPISPQGVAVAYRSLNREYENFELFVNAVDDGSTLTFECAYNSALFEPATLEAWMDRFEVLLRGLVADPAMPLARVPLLSEAERERVLDLPNRTERPIPPGGLHTRIELAAARNPQSIAVRYQDQQQSYAELEARANQIAAELVQQGAAPGRYVALALQRGLELPAALLGILKTGAAYLPLDPEFPADRLAYYLQDSGAVLVLSDRATRPRLPPLSLPALLLEDIGPAPVPTLPPVPADAPAYVIYTSGSTGKPKGVVVSHRNLVNFLASMAEQPGLSAGDCLLAVTTVSFDIAGLELFLPLTVGATVVIADRDTAADGELLKAELARSRANTLQATPSTWRLLLAAGWPGAPGFRAYSGGEPLPRELAEALLPRVGALWNLYGPTETTVWSTASRVTDPTRIAIGRPIANTRCYVLDPRGQPLPQGAVGELWIGGRGVAIGYHARPELTDERFQRDPYSTVPGARMYRSGDLAKWGRDGQLECLGRIDFQVKLRGYRIELGEIEYELSQYPAVAESAVLVRERAAGDARLVAYVALKEGAQATLSELRQHLRELLPPYMIPQSFVDLPALPRLPNGKLDRKALPDPFAGLAEAAAPKTPPRSYAERRIAEIWQQVLGVSGIGVDDRFFDLGGHSLLAAQVAGQLRREHGAVVPLRRLLMDPLALIAKSCEDRLIEPPPEPPPVPADSPRPAELRIPSKAPEPKRPGFWARLFGKT